MTLECFLYRIGLTYLRVHDVKYEGTWNKLHSSVEMPISLFIILFIFYFWLSASDNYMYQCDHVVRGLSRIRDMLCWRCALESCLWKWLTLHRFSFYEMQCMRTLAGCRKPEDTVSVLSLRKTQKTVKEKRKRCGINYCSWRVACQKHRVAINSGRLKTA